MSQRSILFGAIVLVAVAATAFAQPQPPKKNLKLNQPPKRFTLPPNTGQQPGVRVPPPSNVTPQPQPRVTPPPQSGRTGANPVRPEDWLRLFTQPPPPDNSRSGDRSGSNRNTNSVPARGSAPPPARPVLTGDQFATLTLDEQRQVLYSAATSLDQDLGKLNSGASWKTFLSTTSLLKDTAPQQDAAHSAETRERLKRIADQFDKTQLDPQYRAVSGLWGFQMLRNGLREYAAAPVERGQRQLDVHGETLQRSLGQLPTGAGWKTHLQLDELSRLANSKETLGPADRDKALAVAERFEQVAKNPNYRSIAQLDGFETSRQALQRLASQITQLADSQSPGGVLQLADPKSADGILELADPKSPGADDVLQLADPKSADKRHEDVLREILAAMSTQKLSDERPADDTEILRLIKEAMTNDGLKVTVVQFRDAQEKIDEKQKSAGKILQLQDETEILRHIKEAMTNDGLKVTLVQFRDAQEKIDEKNKSAGKILELVDLSEMGQRITGMVNSIQQNLNALPQACEKDKSRHAAQVKQAQDRLAALYELILQQDKEIQQLRDALGAKVTILPLDDKKPAKVTILPLDDKKPEDGKDTDKSTEKKKKP